MKFRRFGPVLIGRGLAYPLFVQFGLRPDGKVRWSVFITPEPWPLSFSERNGLDGGPRIRRARIGRYHITLDRPS